LEGRASDNPIKGRDGEPVKAVKLVTDFSERKMRDDDSQEQIRAIAAMMPPVILARRRPGLNSDPSVEVTGTSPPRPKLERNRKTLSERMLQDAAIKRVNTAKMPTVAWKATQRPM
jgi:hypothetical protein